MPKNKVSIQDGNFERVLAVAFAPVVALTELIKNASDACMTPDDKIAIYIDKQSQKIRIIDNGYGFSHKDIESLFVVGFSSKMRDGNTVSRINEPFAGSKGLGILTAFNLCDKLEIRTFSQDDKKTYHIVWEKGTGEIRWKEIQEQRLGSEFILHGVAAETFQLILLKEELTKLYFSSIRLHTVDLPHPTPPIIPITFIITTFLKSSFTYQTHFQNKWGQKLSPLLL